MFYLLRLINSFPEIVVIFPGLFTSNIPRFFLDFASAVRKLKISFTGSFIEKINGQFQPSSKVTVLKSKKVFKISIKYFVRRNLL